MISIKDLSDIAREIKESDHSMNIDAYLRKNFPFEFPNRGLKRIAKKQLDVHVFHEAITKNELHKEINEETESFIDFIGSTGQRNYTYIVNGSRFSSRQQIQFRGILGANRLEKIILMLLLSDIDYKRIIVYDKNPDYRLLIQDDISSIVDYDIDNIIMGGKIVFGDILNEQSDKKIGSFNGVILSGDLYEQGGKIILYTTFPYGDLCRVVVEELQIIKFRNIFFVGSCGYLNSDKKIGEIIAPIDITDCKGLSLVKKHANFLKSENKKHTSVICPLYETITFIEDLKMHNVSSIDTEISYFQTGIENNMIEDRKSGILLYISDLPGKLECTFDTSDYHSKELSIARRNLFYKLKERNVL